MSMNCTMNGMKYIEYNILPFFFLSFLNWNGRSNFEALAFEFTGPFGNIWYLQESAFRKRSTRCTFLKSTTGYLFSEQSISIFFQLRQINKGFLKFDLISSSTNWWMTWRGSQRSDKVEIIFSSRRFFQKMNKRIQLYY